MSDTAELRLGAKTIELPIVEGSEGERAVDALTLDLYALSRDQQALLRERAAEFPLDRVLVPTRRGDPRRMPTVQAFTPGERYR